MVPITADFVGAVVAIGYTSGGRHRGGGGATFRSNSARKNRTRAGNARGRIGL